MSQQFETGIRPDIAAGALGLHLRVKTTGALALAGITDREIGTIVKQTFANLDVTAVSLVNKPGTVKMVAAGAISKNALVFTAASGKVDATASTAFLIGIAMEAAGADGDVIEVLRTGHVQTAVA